MYGARFPVGPERCTISWMPSTPTVPHDHDRSTSPVRAAGCVVCVTELGCGWRKAAYRVSPALCDVRNAVSSGEGGGRVVASGEYEWKDSA